MYESFFGLNECPFSISPDPRFFYLTSQHKEALAKCRYAVEQKMGLVVIYGDIGTGKTTIARRLFQQFADEPAFLTAMVISPNLKSDNALLRTIMEEFAVTTRRDYRGSLHNFRAFLVRDFDEKKTVILMIDEAQTIRRDMFELLRQLLNYETDTQKLLQIILFGQNELATKLDARPDLKSRVTLFGALSSLSREDMEKMIEFRWHVAGGEALPFDTGAIEAIFRCSRGLPREICKLCHAALTTAFARNTKAVGPELVESATRELRLKEEPHEGDQKADPMQEESRPIAAVAAEAA